MINLKKLSIENGDLIINYRIAYEETNNYIRFLDNFFWVLSSFWIIGTVYCNHFIIDQIGGNNPTVFSVCLIMLLFWVCYLLFWYDIYSKSMYYCELAEQYEKELEIDVLPNSIKEKIEDRRNKKNKKDKKRKEKNKKDGNDKNNNWYSKPFRIIMYVFALCSIALSITISIFNIFPRSNKMNQNDIVKDITPMRYSCVVGTCPSVFVSENDTYVIIGKKQNSKNLPDEIKNKIGESEIAIEVPAGMINELLK